MEPSEQQIKKRLNEANMLTEKIADVLNDNDINVILLALSTMVLVVTTDIYKEGTMEEKKLCKKFFERMKCEFEKQITQSLH